MNSWPTLADPLQRLFGRMTPQRRHLLLGVGAVGLLLAGWICLREDPGSEQALFGGKTYVAAELRKAQSTLREAGINAFRVSGGKIFVSGGLCARCESLLSSESSGKSTFGEHYEKALNQSAWPVSESHRQELMDSARAGELIEMFKADPNIADARLMWNRAKRRTFSSEGKTTCVLGVTPRAGRGISPELAESLKSAVASAFGLGSADDVTLIEHSPQGAKLIRTVAADGTDTSHATAFHPAESTSLSEPVAIASTLEAELTEKLRWIPQVSVKVAANGERGRPVDYDVSVEIPPAVTRSLARRNVRPGRPPEPGAKPRPTQSELRRKIEQIVASKLEHHSDRTAKEFVKVVFHDVPDGSPFSPEGTRTPLDHVASLLQTWPGALSGLGVLLAIVGVLPKLVKSGSTGNKQLTNSEALDEQAATPADAGSPASNATTEAPSDQELGAADRSAREPIHSLVDVAASREVNEPGNHSEREFAMWHDCSADEWRSLLANEPAQTIAVILSRIPPAQSAFVLRLMPAGVRLDVVRRMAALEVPSSVVIAELANVLEDRLRTLRQSRLNATREPQETRATRPGEPIAPILEALGRGSVLKIETPADIPPAEFDDLRMLDDGSLRELFASFDVEHWSIALKGADESVASKLSDSLAANDAASLRTALETVGPVRLSDVDSAQRAIAERLAPLRWRGRRTHRPRRQEAAK